MDGAKKASLRSSTLLEHQNPSQSNFSSMSEDDNLMDGARRANLRNSALLEHQNTPHSNFNSKGENNKLMDGARKTNLKSSAFWSTNTLHKAILAVG